MKTDPGFDIASIEMKWIHPHFTGPKLKSICHRSESESRRGSWKDCFSKCDETLCNVSSDRPSTCVCPSLNMCSTMEQLQFLVTRCIALWPIILSTSFAASNFPFLVWKLTLIYIDFVQGYIPGKVSENVIGERHCKTVAIAGRAMASKVLSRKFTLHRSWICLKQSNFPLVLCPLMSFLCLRYLT